MDQTPAAVVPTNQEVAEKLGLTHSGVSRIRSGDRHPSIATMRRIETAYRWPIDAQITSREEGTYAQDFERALVGDTDTDR